LARLQELIREHGGKPVGKKSQLTEQLIGLEFPDTTADHKSGILDKLLNPKTQDELWETLANEECEEAMEGMDAEVKKDFPEMEQAIKRKKLKQSAKPPRAPKTKRKRKKTSKGGSPTKKPTKAKLAKDKDQGPAPSTPSEAKLVAPDDPSGPSQCAPGTPAEAPLKEPQTPHSPAAPGDTLTPPQDYPAAPRLWQVTTSLAAEWDEWEEKLQQSEHPPHGEPVGEHSEPSHPEAKPSAPKPNLFKTPEVLAMLIPEQGANSDIRLVRDMNHFRFIGTYMKSSRGLSKGFGTHGVPIEEALEFCLNALWTRYEDDRPLSCKRPKNTVLKNVDPELLQEVYDIRGHTQKSYAKTM
jgi:hypothetical protein